MEIKNVIKQAVGRMKAGNGTDEDKTIMHLLEQCRDLKLRLEDYRRNGAVNQNVPVHKDNPWYMQ